MKNKVWKQAFVSIFSVTFLLFPGAGYAENIDPDDDGSQYAWGENVGWFNAEPSGNGGPGVEVEDTKLTGYIWAENIGWVSLSCENTSSCATVDYGVTNDGCGDLSGYAWAENVGWISFSCENTSSCGTVDYGVSIDPNTGEFAGYAWGENIGWVSLSCENTSSCATVDYGVTTSWTGVGCMAGLTGWVWMNGQWWYSMDESNWIYMMVNGTVWHYIYSTGQWTTDNMMDGWVYCDFYPSLWSHMYAFWFYCLPPSSGFWLYHYSTGQWTWMR
jgi:hypothetical protein